MPLATEKLNSTLRQMAATAYRQLLPQNSDRQAEGYRRVKLKDTDWFKLQDTDG